MFLPTDENLLFISIFIPHLPPAASSIADQKTHSLNLHSLHSKIIGPPAASRQPDRIAIIIITTDVQNPSLFIHLYSGYSRIRKPHPKLNHIDFKGKQFPPCGWFIAVCCEMRSAVSVFVCARWGGWENVFLFKTISLARKTKARDSFIKTHRALLPSKSNNPQYVGTEPIIADYNCFQALKVNLTGNLSPFLSTYS